MSQAYKNRLSGYEQINTLSALIGFKVPIDGLLTALLGTPTVDVLALDKRLMAVYNYSGCMNEFVLKQFGKIAIEILEQH